MSSLSMNGRVFRVVDNELCEILKEKTLRDEFALAALPALMLRWKEKGYSDEAAVWEAYRVADIALKASIAATGIRDRNAEDRR